MSFKKLVMIALSLTLVFSVLLGSVASAEEISQEKRNLMIAAGEIPPDQAVTEKDVKIKKDEAVKIAKSLLENAASYELGNIYLSPRWGTKAYVWNMDFYLKKNPGGNANVSIDADTGEVFGLNVWENYEGQNNFIAKFTREEARKIAEEYLKKKFGMDMDSYELQKENPYYYGYRMGGVKEQLVYNFNYIKKFNGVPLTNYTVNVGVDGTNGKVRNYYSNKIDIDLKKLPSTEGILTAEDAMQKYKDSVNISLQYITSYEEKFMGPAQPKIMLAYVPYTYISMIDAKTGKVVNYDGTELDVEKQEFQELAKNPVPMNPDAELKDKAVTQTEAKAAAEKYKAYVEKLFNIQFESAGQGGYQPYYENGQDEIWNFNWNSMKDNRNIYLNVSVNGKTGHMNSLSIGQYDYSYDIQAKEGKGPAEVKAKITWKQGREKALQIVKSLAPDQYGFYVDENIKEPAVDPDTLKYMRDYYYSFTRVVNGIRYRENNMRVNIDRETGELSNFYMNWSDREFPSGKAVVSEEEAAAKYFEGTEARLAYHLWSKYDQASGMDKFVDAPILVYNFMTKGYMYGNGVVNAATGKLVDWSGRELKAEEVPADPKLPEHWAKRSMELLIAQGVMKDPFAAYDAAVTRSEAVKMMSIAKGVLYYYYEGNRVMDQSFTDVSKDSDDYVFVESAVRQKILTETGGKFNGGEEITGGEYVKLLVNMMGFGDIAKHKEVFTISGASNVSDEMKGYAAVCQALGVLPVKAGEAFDANDKVSYAEAAAALYKALEYIR